MKRVRVEVTTEDIRKARSYRGNLPPTKQCPIARATCRALGKKLGAVQVGPEGIYGAAVNRNRLPLARISRFISKFDAEEEVSPFSFTLYIREAK